MSWVRPPGLSSYCPSWHLLNFLGGRFSATLSQYQFCHFALLVLYESDSVRNDFEIVISLRGGRQLKLLLSGDLSQQPSTIISNRKRGGWSELILTRIGIIDL